MATIKLAKTIQRFHAILDEHPRCFYCDKVLPTKLLRGLVLVSDEQRLAHQACVDEAHALGVVE